MKIIKFSTKFTSLAIGCCAVVSVLGMGYVVSSAKAWLSDGSQPAKSNEVNAAAAKRTVKLTSRIVNNADVNTFRKPAPAVPASTPTTASPTNTAVLAAGAVISPQGYKLFVDRSNASGRPEAITSQPVARWFGGWNSDVRADVNRLVSAAESEGAVATLVAYNIPNRDCGSYSAGGASSVDAYKSWIRALAAGIGQRNALVILEPDALAGMDCLSGPNQQARTDMIADAVNVLGAQTKAQTYIDAGNATWIPVGTMVDRLNRANVSQARGFALNVSNFLTTSVSTNYGEAIAQRIGKRYVVDTSRNGRGADPTGEWCNPRGRALGQRPTTSPNSGSADAFLWIKYPGESDGNCNGGPQAGQWFPEYAQELIQNS